jgi:RIO kinase 1
VLSDPAASGPRPAPPWLPTGRVEDQTIGLLKTGKEAEVFVVERTSIDDGRRCLLVNKRYRPVTVTAKGELEAAGFARARTFVDDTIYHEGRRFRRSRDQRAVERMTARGKALLNARWIHHEYDMLVRLWDAGVNVPYPVEAVEDGCLMELIGDEVQAAPRLSTARLDAQQLASAFDQVIADVGRMADAGLVHADLSPFNLLWWDERVYVIDVPQTTDLWLNPNGFALLHRDIERMCTWFARKGHRCDPDEVFAGVLP